MGIYDEIIVSKAYLKGLLTKKQEKLLKVTTRFGGSVRGVLFRSKGLEDSLRCYKLYRQKLFVNDKSLWNCEPPKTEQRTPDTPKKYPYEKGRWDRVMYNGSIDVYEKIQADNGNFYWVEFKFTFLKGILDKKELIKFEMRNSINEDEKRSTMREAFEKTLKYKFYDKVSTILYKLQEWAYQKTLLPVTKNTKKKEKLSFWKHS